MSQSILEIDGSFGEGGGQILRTSLALSLITGRAFHLRNIRRGRSKPGLQPQHVASVKAAAAISGAQLRGATKDSIDLVFEPGPVAAGDYHFAIGTAGATGLVLHTVYLPLALRTAAPSTITVGGGTHVPFSPCFHFLDVTWRRYMHVLGLQIDLLLERPGFYPRGGGKVQVKVHPCRQLKGLHLASQHVPTSATGVSAVAGLPLDIAKRQARRASYRLAQAGIKANIQEEAWRGGPGSVLAVVLETQPVPTLFFGLGARGKPAESVADETVEQAVEYVQTCPCAVDAHSADQLLLPLALAEGPSAFSVGKMTQHLFTNVAVIRQFLERDMNCEGKEGDPGCVRIAGGPSAQLMDARA
jgi:RNA 3'-terminal phosphate cyclase (ATP)